MNGMKSASASRYTANLDHPLVFLTGQDNDAITLRIAFQSFNVFGRTGSGKTSGPLRILAEAALRHGFGVLALAAKPDDRANWQELCRKTGRLDDFRVFAPDQPGSRFNFLDWTYRTSGTGQVTDNVASLFQNVMELRNQSSGSSGDPFWGHAVRQALCSTIDGLGASGMPISLPNIYETLISAPTGPEQVADDAWHQQAMCGKMIAAAAAQKKLTPMQEIDTGLMIDYFMKEVPYLSDRTWSSIKISFTSLAQSLLRGHLREMFCTSTEISPDDVFAGRVVVVDIAPLVWHEMGVFAEVIWKLCFQRAVMARDIRKNPRPAALFIDEAPLTALKGDAAFQAVCRGSNVMCCYAAQNLPMYYSALGGQSETLGKALTMAFLGNTATSIFCSNDCAVTNDYAANLIGREYLSKESFSASFGGVHGGSQGSAGFTTERQFLVEPVVFQRLRQGGPPTNEVESVVFKGGTPWPSSGENYLVASFKQE
jgi:type IV secretory pathway TraG/TraD family ATPase VirD4